MAKGAFAHSCSFIYWNFLLFKEIFVIIGKILSLGSVDMNLFFSRILAIIMAILSFFGVKGADNNKVPKNWLLGSIPYYENGVYSEKLYDCGSGLESDKAGPVESDSQMQIIRSTTLNDVSSYCKKLANNGYTKIFENETSQNYTYVFKDSNGRLLYFSYCDPKKEVRIIDEVCSAEVGSFGYAYTPSADECAEVFQYCFPYHDVEVCTDKEIYSTNGMLYVIRLADNKLMVIDGGSLLQSSDENIDSLMAFLNEITQTDENEKVEIALWFGTHPHKDHMLVFSKLLNKYHNRINIERTMFNYPSAQLLGQNKLVDILRSQFKTYYPDAEYLKPHAGYTFSLSDINIDVLYTHENLIDAETCAYSSDSLNDGCTVLRLDIHGKTFMILGDINKDAQQVILDMYTARELKSDVCQGAHHMYNNVKKLYGVISPEYVFCPQSGTKAKNSAAYKSLIEFNTAQENFLFANEALYGITVKDGELAVSVRDFHGVPYDGSNYMQLINQPDE